MSRKAEIAKKERESVMRYIQAKQILSKDLNINIYRGCTHGCIYCDSRSSCYQIDDFENVMVKENALDLLGQELAKKRSKGIITSGSMSDPYVHIEKDLQYTRKMLEIILEYGFGINILTKSALILRDLDLYRKINAKNRAIVNLTITTFDDKLCSILEPHVSKTSERFEVLKTFSQAEITTGIWLGPILPFINDTPENIGRIVDAAHEAGVSYILVFDFGLTLRTGNREYFYAQLDRHFPGLKYDYQRLYGNQFEVPSLNRTKLWEVFLERCQKYGIITDFQTIWDLRKSRPQIQEQLSLF